MRFLVLTMLMFGLAGCGESSGIPAEGPIVVTYQAQNSWVDEVMRSAEQRLQVLDRPVQLRPGEPYALRVELSEDGWSEGRAKICSVRPGSGWVKITQFNDKGDRTQLAIVFVLHEVGHMLGARHKEQNTIMHLAAGGLEPLEKLVFSKESIEEMNSCIANGRKTYEQHRASDRRVF